MTSSNPIAGGALVGAGLGPTAVDRVVGVTKAYVTRVGAGPFPTEDTGPSGEHMARIGHEFGTTTGRARRCGWFDVILLRYAARLNGLTEIFLTKLDVLSGLPSVKLCVAYRHEGTRYDDFPPHQSVFHKAEPLYEELPGWSEDMRSARRVEDLPTPARRLVNRIAELGGVGVRHLSVGPDREQTLEVADPEPAVRPM